MNDTFQFGDGATAGIKASRDPKDCFFVHSDVEVIVRDRDGNIKSRSFQKNLRTNVGADFWNTQLFSTGAAAAQANYIALTTDATAAGLGDTTLTSEETLNGLARAQALVTHTGSAVSTLLSKTFTYTGSSSKVIAKVGLFNAVGPPPAGTLVLETLLSSTATVNANGDQVTVNWTVNF